MTITKKEMFTAISAYITETMTEDLIAETKKGEVVVSKEEIVDFLFHEVALLSRPRKASANPRPNKKQEANNALREKILRVLTTDTPMTIADIRDVMPEFNEKTSSQQISSLLSPMVKAGLAVKVTENRKAAWRLPRLGEIENVTDDMEGEEEA